MNQPIEALQEPLRLTDLNPTILVEHIIERGEGRFLSNGAIAVRTGRRTGRSPKDRFIVRDSVTESTVDWNTINQPFAKADFDALWRRVQTYLDQRSSYRGHMHVGAHPDHYLPVVVNTEFAWHQMFATALFVQTTDFNPKSKPVWTVLNVPGFECEPERDKTRSDGTVIVDFTGRRVLVAGMRYAGEMKKAMFSVMNFLVPDDDILPMHCSANVDAAGKVALFFGLSGTGKTTLSSDEECLLIGDDEHGWGTDTVFNFEGGCYAKCINLQRETEPVIYDAIRFGAILENVDVNEETREPDFFSSKFTENTRAVYPRSNIRFCVPDNRAGEPETIIFLTCDVSGVLPPVSILSKEAAAYHFLSGYTAQVGSTVVGATEPFSATFSAGFGAAFLPRPPRVYAELLMHRIETFGSKVFLVNTGWTGGAYKDGHRISIPDTRRIVRAVRSGELDEVPTTFIPRLNLTIPTQISGIDSTILNPRNTWSDPVAYDLARDSLIAKFNENFAQFETSQAIVDAGPK